MKRRKLNFPLLVFFVFLLVKFSNGSTIDKVAHAPDYEQMLNNALVHNDMVDLEKLLHVADEKNKENFRQFLLEYTIHDKYDHKTTVLHKAIDKNNEKLVKILLDFFPKTEETNLIKVLKRKDSLEKCNAIRYGIRNAWRENTIWETLFEKFPDQPDEVSKLLLEKNKYGKSIFEDVTFQDFDSKKLNIVLKKFPETKYADLSNFLLTTEKTFSNIVSYGSEENIKLALNIVKENNPEEYVKIFFKKGNHGDGGLLHSARSRGSKKILLEEFPKIQNEEKFIKFINMRDWNNNTMIDWARKDEWLDIVKILLPYLPENNTEFFYEKECGYLRRSILCLATRVNDSELVQMLLEKFAQDHDDEEMINFLMQENESLSHAMLLKNEKILQNILDAFPKQDNEKVINFLMGPGIFETNVLGIASIMSRQHNTTKHMKLVFDMFPLNAHNPQELCNLILQENELNESPLLLAPNEIVNLLIQKIYETEIEKKEKKKILWMVINCILKNLNEKVTLKLSNSSIDQLIEIDYLFASAKKEHFEENALEAFRNIRLASISLWMKNQQRKKGIHDLILKI